MDKFIPSNYQELIGSIVLLFTFLLITFKNKQKSNSRKLFAMLFVISLALFSAHWSTYFAAIFIIATAVTELEFLQNLAAIIRKDENYFKFKQETLSTEDNIKRKLAESMEDELVEERKKKESNTTKIDLNEIKDISRSLHMKLALDIEEKALNFISPRYGNIQHGIRLTNNGKSVEFDGIISNKLKNIIFEVKWIRNSRQAFPLMMHSQKRFMEMLNRHKEITGVSSEAYFVLVINEKNSLNEKRIQRLTEKANEVNISIILLSLEELGFEVIPETPNKSEEEKRV